MMLYDMWCFFIRFNNVRFTDWFEASAQRSIRISICSFFFVSVLFLCFFFIRFIQFYSLWYFSFLSFFFSCFSCFLIFFSLFIFINVLWILLLLLLLLMLVNGFDSLIFVFRSFYSHFSCSCFPLCICVRVSIVSCRVVFDHCQSQYFISKFNESNT